MRLREIADVVGCSVVRDGEFRNLGLLSHQREAMLVQFYDAHYSPALQQTAVSPV